MTSSGPEVGSASFFRDLLGTGVTSVATVLCLAGTTKLLAEGLGAEGFGAYAIVRRLVAVVEPLTTLTLGVALTRYVAMSEASEQRDYYLIAGAILVSLPVLSFLALGFGFADSLARVLFIDSQAYTSLFNVTVLMVAAYSLYIVLYAYYRGLRRMSLANLWQLAVIAVGPLAIAWGWGESSSVTHIVALMAGLLGLASAPLALHLYSAVRRVRVWASVRSAGIELARYGLPRIAGGFAFAGILAVGPLLAPYWCSLREAGFLVAGQMILRMIEGGTEAFGRAALPRLAQVYSTAGIPALRERVEDLLSLILHLGVFACIHIMIWSESLVIAWLGNEYLGAVAPVRVTLLALVPYLAFVTLRAVVDAIEVRAVTTVALCISFLVTVGFSGVAAWWGAGVIGLALGTAVGLLVLGTLVGVYVWRAFKIDRSSLSLWACLGLNALFACVSFGVATWLRGVVTSPMVTLGSGMFVEIGVFVIYLLSLRGIEVRWIRDLERRIVVEVTTRRQTAV